VLQLGLLANRLHLNLLLSKLLVAHLHGLEAHELLLLVELLWAELLPIELLTLLWIKLLRICLKLPHDWLLELHWHLNELNMLLEVLLLILLHSHLLLFILACRLPATLFQVHIRGITFQLNQCLRIASGACSHQSTIASAAGLTVLPQAVPGTTGPRHDPGQNVARSSALHSSIGCHHLSWPEEAMSDAAG